MIGKNWLKTSLGQLGTFRNGINFNYTQEGAGIAIVKVKDFGEHFFVPHRGMDELNSQLIDVPENLILKEGDTVIIRSNGNPALVGRSLYFRGNNRPVTFSGFCIRFRPATEKLCPLFATYFIKSPFCRARFTAYGSGTGIQNLNQGILADIPVHLPPLPEQQAIAHILGSLDDKIELNRQMNETLEGIARALFKSWFVDFDPVRAKMEGRQPYGMDAETAALFPDGFEGSVLGEIPRGWRVAKFTDFIKIFKKSVIPNQQLNEIFDHYSIPAFDKERLPTFERGEQIKSNKFLAPEGAILLSKINPTIPRVWFPFIGANEHRSICSTEFLVILPKEVMSSEFLYAFFSTNYFQERFIALTTGTSNSHQRVSSNELLNMVLLIPNLKLIEHFTEVARPLYIMMNQNLGESKTLATLRDTLLPKLLSGELRVGQAEKEVGAML